MQNNILFDNIYIGHSEEDAKKFAEETWVIKYKIEKDAEDLDSKPEPAEVCYLRMFMCHKIMILYYLFLTYCWFF